MASLLPNGKQQYTDSAGAPLVGGKLYTYLAGTSTPQATYQDAAGTVPNTNPIILDGRGEAVVFWAGAYKAVLKSAADATIWTVDGFTDPGTPVDTLRSQLAASTGSSLVGHFDGGTGGVTRTVQAKLRDILSIKDKGALGDGLADDTAAFQVVLSAPAAGKTLMCLVPDGTYLLSSSPIIGAGRVHWVFGRNVSLTGAGVLPFAPTKVQLGGSPIAPTKPTTEVIEGNAGAPFTDITYVTPSAYFERHTNGANADSCDWGNSKKHAPVTVEVIAYGAETGECSAFAGRVFSATAAPAGAQPLVGIAAVAQSNAPAAQANREVFGANFVVASSTGNKPVNMVGIEVDVIPSQSATTLRPGQGGADNFTAYWAQSAGGTITANTAFFASATGTGGWNYGMVIDCNVQAYLQYLRTSVNAPTAKGIRVETQYQANTGRLLELFCGALEYMRVDGDSNSPVWIRSEGVLKQITAGAADSAGAGFKYLKVVN
jgi:hypothetical protein